MSIFSNMFRQEAARQASKTATDALWTQGDGTSAYRLAGKIFIGCGVVWILISLIPIAVNEPVSKVMGMWIVAAIQIIGGAVLVILSKKSKRFQEWADKDFAKDLIKKRKLEEKIKLGNKILPMTYGDLLALKILAVIFIVLIVIMIIGYFQGWVV